MPLKRRARTPRKDLAELPVRDLRSRFQPLFSGVKNDDRYGDGVKSVDSSLLTRTVDSIITGVTVSRNSPQIDRKAAAGSRHGWDTAHSL